MKFESQRIPFLSGLLIRQVSIPYPIKNSLVALGGVPFHIYLLTLWPKISYTTALSVFYSISIRNFSELLGSHHHKGETEQEVSHRHFIDKIRYTLFVATITLMFLILCYIKRRLKEFNLLLERIEDGKYDAHEIPPGFDIRDIANEQPMDERKVASMANNYTDSVKKKDYFSSGKVLNRSAGKPLDTECRNIFETEPSPDTAPERLIK